MNYQALSSELFRALRGRRSQVALSRRLGYAANVAYAWESGRRAPPARVLFRLAVLNRLSLGRVAAFVEPAMLALPAKRAWSSADTAALLQVLVGEAPINGLARKLAVDRTTLARWLRGATEPGVPDLLRIVDVTRQRVVEFVEIFSDPAGLPSLRELSRVLLAQRRTAYEVPWSHAVLRALELASYRKLATHTPGVLARAIGIDAADEADLLEQLAEARLIRRSRGKWQLSRVLTVDTRADPKRDQRLKEHWARVALERLQKGTAEREAFYSYNLCAVSEADLARIRELHVEYYERVRQVVAESKLAERVLLLNQQLIPLDE